MKYSSASASNAGKAAPAFTAPTMSSSVSDTAERMGFHLPCADGPLSPRCARLTESEGDVVLSRPREAASSLGSFSGNLCAEFGQDIDLHLIKLAVASSCPQSSGLCGNLYANLDWDIDLYLSRRLVASSGLESSCPSGNHSADFFLGDRFEREPVQAY